MSDWKFGIFSSWTDECADWLEQHPSRKAMIIGDAPRELPPQVFYFAAPTLIHREFALQKAGQLSAFADVQLFSPELENSFLRSKLHAEMRLSDAADLGIKRIHHLLMNGRLHLSSLQSIAGAFQGFPAVIVGAGSSLEELDLLPLKGKALIISAGNGLKKSPVEPDLALITDPHIPLDRSRYPNVSLCIQGRVHPETLQSPPKSIFYFPDTSPPLEGWLMGEEILDAGWNGANSAVEVAHLLGCAPIYLAGVDLCYEEGAEARAPLVEFEGKKTQRDWILAAEWLREKAEEYKIYQLSQRGISVAPFTCLPTLDSVLPPIPLGRSIRLRSEKLVEWRDALESKSALAQKLLLDPLWNLWSPLFEREKTNLEIQKKLFWERVVREHLEVLKEEKRTFYLNGQLKTIERFFGGEREGETLLYWSNGTLKRRVCFHRGVREGREEFWDDHGEVCDV